MLQSYRNFLRGLSTNWVGKLGVALTTSSFLLFLGFETLSAAGFLRNAYVGLLTYLTLPALFVVGLLLIPCGWLLYARQSGKSTRVLLAERFDHENLERRWYGARLFRIVAGLTLLNLAFLAFASGSMLHYMDQPTFCGTACHVMNPEWTAYQDSPHASVACVECHVGEGVGALVQSKRDGARQTLLYMLGSYSRPVPTPVHQLRPAEETCGDCHSGRPVDRRIVSRVRHDFDRDSTPRYTTLALKLGDDSEGIHWHAAPGREVRYASRGDAREEILWVEVTREDGSVTRYTRQGVLADGDAHERRMDCVDCHNRASHVYEEPEAAVDRQLARGALDRRLPFAKREALAALTAGYPDRDAALRGIERHLSGFYRREHPEVAIARSREIDGAIDTLQSLYTRNVHPEMQIAWNTYPSLAGHRAPGEGCFRCHDESMRDEADRTLPRDCTLCHSILAEESPTPFQFVLEPREGDRERTRHEHLRREFLESFGAETPPAPRAQAPDTGT